MCAGNHEMDLCFGALGRVAYSPTIFKFRIDAGGQNGSIPSVTAIGIFDHVRAPIVA